MIKPYFRRLKFLWLSFFLTAGIAAHAQGDTNARRPADTSGKAQQPPRQDAALPVPKRVDRGPVEVTGAFRYKNGAVADSTASIGDIIVVQVSNIESLMRQYQCKDTTGNDLPATACKPQGVRLFINGIMITGITPVNGEPEKFGNGQGQFQFRLDRNDQNDETWANILGAPPLFSTTSFDEPVSVSVGLENGAAVPIRYKAGERHNFNFVRIHRGWFWGCFWAVAGYYVLLVYLIRKKGLLRDRVITIYNTGITTVPQGWPSPGSIVPPYSLSRLQMVFWFSLVVTSFLFLWLITDAYNILSSSVLALIGISAGTSLSALVIDNSKKQDLINSTKTLEAQLIPLESENKVLAAAGNAALTQDQQQTMNVNASKITQLQTEIAGNLEQLRPLSTDSFLNDILTDVNGISFHRLQMLVWTVVFGMIFIYSVWKQLSMPDFDPTLLALQGITAGTYLGFKLPEKQS